MHFATWMDKKKTIPLGYAMSVKRTIIPLGYAVTDEKTITSRLRRIPLTKGERGAGGSSVSSPYLTFTLTLAVSTKSSHEAAFSPTVGPSKM